MFLTKYIPTFSELAVAVEMDYNVSGIYVSIVFNSPKAWRMLLLGNHAHTICKSAYSGSLFM